MLRALAFRWSDFCRRHWLAFLGAALMVYFGYHAVNGSRGLIAWYQYQREIEAARAELARVQAERTALQHKVELLRDEALDPDLLDEAARRTLSLVDPGDVIILLEHERDGQ
jgi:cell division protein FtsB